MLQANANLRISVQCRQDYDKDPNIITIKGRIDKEDTIKLPAIDLRAAVIATVDTIEGIVRMRLMVRSAPGRELEMILTSLSENIFKEKIGGLKNQDSLRALSPRIFDSSETPWTLNSQICVHMTGSLIFLSTC